MADLKQQNDAVRYHVVVSGRVQGVGFRYFSQREAQAGALVGWARNRPDGTVEIEIQGSESETSKFLGKIAVGPSMAMVKNVFQESIPTRDDQRTFCIRM